MKPAFPEAIYIFSMLISKGHLQRVTDVILMNQRTEPKVQYITPEEFRNLKTISKMIFTVPWIIPQFLQRTAELIKDFLHQNI